MQAKPPFLKHRGTRELFGKKFIKQCCGSISPETIWKRTREEGRAEGGRGSVIGGPRRQAQEPGTSIRNDGTDMGTNTSAGRRGPPAHSSISRRVLSGWLTWFGKEVPFYNSARDSSQSLATQYDVLTFFKKRKQNNSAEHTWSLSGAHTSIFGFLSNAVHHRVHWNRSQFPSRKNSKANVYNL